jgi:hypothetical protein
MKKNLFFISVAVLALSSCNNDTVVDENLSANQPKEITIQAIATPTTRTAVDGTTFTPTTMEVAAWDVTNGRDFFTATTFTKDASTWKGSKYWPLSAAYINFLAYTELNAGSATWNLAGDGKAASGVTLVMADNKTAQKDLMYAIGNGEVSQTANSLSFPDNVEMTFKHAQAWICFKADAYDATSGGKVTLKSITLNGAKYNGTFTVTHTNYNASSEQAVTGAWSALGDAQNVAVPNWTAATIAYDADGDGVTVGDGLLIVPDGDNATADFTSFTIAYSLDGNDYTYTYAPLTAAAANVDQAKKYTFKINFHLHEIEIAPTITDWVEGGPTDVPIF